MVEIGINEKLVIDLLKWLRDKNMQPQEAAFVCAIAASSLARHEEHIYDLIDIMWAYHDQQSGYRNNFN